MATATSSDLWCFLPKTNFHIFSVFVVSEKKLMVQDEDKLKGSAQAYLEQNCGGLNEKNRFLVFGKQTYTSEAAAIGFKIFRSITHQENTWTTRNKDSTQIYDSADGRSQEKNVTLTTTEQDGDSTCAKGGNRNVLKVSKSDRGITRHLKTSSQCREAVCKSNVTARFQVIARARNASHLGFLEALFIGRHAPALCAQKEFVRTLGLF